MGSITAAVTCRGSVRFTIQYRSPSCWSWPCSNESRWPGTAREWDSLSVLLIIYYRFDHGLNADRYIREEIESGERFNLIDADPERAPISKANTLRVRHDDGDRPRRCGNAGHVVRTHGQYYDYLPGLGRNRNVAIRNCRRSSTVGTRPARPHSARDDVQLVAGGHECSAITFQSFPRSLIVVGRLRDHISHEEGRRVVGYRDRAIRRRRHVATIKARTRVISTLDLIPTRGKRRIGAIIILTRRAAHPARIEVPACPGRRPSISMIAKHVLRLFHQKICRLVNVENTI